MENNNLVNDLKNLLVPPGNGVFTVHTASNIIEDVQKKIYHASDISKVKDQWLKSLEGIHQFSGPLLFGICSDCGGGIQRGANWGPLFIRQSLLEHNQSIKMLDIGDAKIIPHLLHDKYLNDETIQNCRTSLYGDSSINLPVSPLSIAEKVCDLINSTDNCPPIFTMGGDHSVSYPVVKSWIRSRKKLGKKVAIIHFDAHTDLLANRQGIDLCFATWAYQVLDDLDSPSDLIQLGIRSSGKDKDYWEKNIGIKQFWANEIKTLGPDKISEEVMNHLKPKNIDEVYVSFDIDALDKQFASATGTPEEDGLSPEVPLIILSSILNKYKLTGADLVEVAPWVQREDDATPGQMATLLSSSSIANFLIENMEQ